MPEYGRNVQKMVDYLNTIEDRQKRNEQARAIVKVMEILNPQVYLQENYTRPISVSELAEHASICERECLRCFRKILRLSPIQYLIRYRISRACILLKDTDLSVLEIASSCGFESPSYFTKTFRQHVGCTPRAYRNQ